jgi:hypothetical protein
VSFNSLFFYADGMMGAGETRPGGYVDDEPMLQRLADSLLRSTFKRRVRVARLWLSAEKFVRPMCQGVLFVVPGADALAVTSETERVSATRLAGRWTASTTATATPRHHARRASSSRNVRRNDHAEEWDGQMNDDLAEARPRPEHHEWG